jgi:glycerol uptake facilitator-like aquaporin
MGEGEAVGAAANSAGATAPSRCMHAETYALGVSMMLCVPAGCYRASPCHTLALWVTPSLDSSEITSTCIMECYRDI